MLFPILLSCLLALTIDAQSTTSSDPTVSSASASPSTSLSISESSSTTAPTQSSDILIGTLTGSVVSGASVVVPSGPYLSYSNQITLSLTTSTSNNSRNATTTRSSSTSSSSNSLLLVGSNIPTTTNVTASTTSAATATNTAPCNNYPEFCSRKYSNITEICAHNYAFVKEGNAASNQEIQVLGQLNDGVRMLSTEAHFVNNTLYLCHTNCNLLNVGTLESHLTTVRQWVDVHPYDVVSILLVNSNFVGVGNYTTPIQNSGLGQYVYTPPKIPMRLEDWPTLSEMIISSKRVVVFMDYMANQTEVPYILDEFSQIWETPFSPTNASFPCTEQRPPNLPRDQALDRLYLANHNLNVEISLLGTTILIPNLIDLNAVNAANGSAPSLGAMATECTNDWEGRPPNFLLVDFYNRGNGSVFEVAAKMNNVTYNRPCCGQVLSLNGVETLRRPAMGMVMMLVGIIVLTFMVQ